MVCNISFFLFYSIALVMHNSGQHVPEWMLEMKKATKNEKKKLSAKHPERGHVSQGVLYEKLQKRKMKYVVHLNILIFCELTN